MTEKHTEAPGASEDSEDGQHGKGHLSVVVHDEDAGGKPFSFHEKEETLVAAVIEDLYRKLKTERKPDDRLVCIGSGESVFAHEQEQLGRYAQRCPGLEWGWSRKTGGA
jgi:hypothetical protein